MSKAEWYSNYFSVELGIFNNQILHRYPYSKEFLKSYFRLALILAIITNQKTFKWCQHFKH